MKNRVVVGNTAIGTGEKIAVQTMLSVPSSDVKANIEQAKLAEKLGCEILRVSVPTKEDVRLIEAIKNEIGIPLVADIHFDYKIAVACVEAGVDKIRLNPGNIGGRQNVATVAKLCAKKNVPIRIGVNAGSLEKEVLARYGAPTPEAIVESALSHIAMLEAENFNNIVVSLKSSHVPTMVQSYALMSKKCDYPLHLGVTEGGTHTDAVIKNAMGMGTLLMQGIGDTIRVSVSGGIEQEIEAGYSILRAAGRRNEGVEIISCPTCGRTNIPVEEIATILKKRLHGCKKNLKVAVMGCVVNGIGEGKEADIGIAGGKDSAVLFVKGEQQRVLKGNYVDELVNEIEKL